MGVRGYDNTHLERNNRDGVAINNRTWMNKYFWLTRLPNYVREISDFLPLGILREVAEPYSVNLNIESLSSYPE